MFFETIDITDAEHSYAYSRAKAIISEAEKNGLNPLFQTDPLENHILGELGEALFHKWLRKNNIKHSLDNTHIGESDETDFFIGSTRWDIKTNLRKQPIENLKENFQLMLHKEQLGRHADYYFWIFVLGKVPSQSRKAVLVGSLNAKRVHEYPIVEKIRDVPAYWIPLKDVKTPSETLGILRDLE